MKPFAAPVFCLLSAGISAFAQQAPGDKPVISPPAASSAGVAAALTAAAPNTLLDGTAIKLRLTETLTSATAKAGQQVSFEVVEEVDVQGVAVIPKGTQALATVTDAASKKSMGRGGKLDVNVDSTRLVDGEKVLLRAVRDVKGGGHTAVMTGAIVASAIVFFPAAPLFLFIHGKDITIPKGTEVTAFIQGDMKLDMAKLVPPPVPGAVPASVETAMASISVASNMPGADIEVDGAFVGSTPSTVSLTPGAHVIGVKKKGYADWSRTMNVAGSGAHLTADLEATAK